MSAEKIKAGLETDRREDILKLVEHIESNRKEIEVAVKEYTDGSQVKG
jgi:ABC-type metal ion transport system substrate-binding protein